MIYGHSVVIILHNIACGVVAMQKDKVYCYTSTQNTCKRLVQITPSDVHKYAIRPVTASATTL